jgi:glycosyltransferase involved in cell wall biosynthesis
MKVVMIHGQFPADTSHIRELANLVDLTVYGRCSKLRGDTVDPPSPPVECSSRVLRPVPLTPLGPKMWLYPGLGAALDVDAPDIIDAHGEPWRLPDVHASNWARRHPRTGFLTHGSDRNWWAVSPLERTVRRFFARRTLGRIDGFVGESAGAVRAAQRFELPEAVVTAVIHSNPRDPEVFRPPNGPGERSEARRRLSLAVDGYGVGFIGRLSPEKGPLLFFDALRRAAGELPANTWAAVLGAGPQEKEVRARAQRENVAVLGWLSYPEDVATFYRAIDVLVVPSRRIGSSEEQGPRAVIEAMLSSCAIVATRVGGVPEMLDGVGILVKEDDIDALARGIVQALRDPSSANLRVKARQRAIERYSGSATARALVATWTKALERRRGAGR